LPSRRVFEYSVHRKGWHLFGSSIEEPLLLDLPTQTLGENELKRAMSLFQEIAVDLEQWEVLDHPNGIAVGSQSGFQASFGSDADEAARMAARIFDEVYGLPVDFDLRIVLD